jgi:hypothetical protein
MGVNISIQTLDFQDHPDWDIQRHSGDREVWSILAANGGTIHQPGYDPWLHGEPLIRPADLEAARKGQWPDVNADRWKQMLDILADKKWWLSIVY